MIGGLIAATTAFIVAGLHLTQPLFWIVPTLLGTFFIRYNIKKHATSNSSSS
jgi:hypothetical protein